MKPPNKSAPGRGGPQGEAEYTSKVAHPRQNASPNRAEALFQELKASTFGIIAELRELRHSRPTFSRPTFHHESRSR